MSYNKKIIEKINKLIGSDSVNQFCKNVGLNQSNTNKFLTGKKYSISLDDLIKIASHYGLTLDYFINDSVAFPDEKAKKKPAGEEKPAHKDYDMIPFYEVKVSAGNGSILSDERSRLMPVERSFVNRLGYRPQELAVVEVCGDSMEPGLRNGDYVIVHLPRTPVDFNAGIYVIRDFSGVKIKRLDMDKDGNLEVISDNRVYGAQIYTAEEVDNKKVEIIGRVVSKLAMI